MSKSMNTDSLYLNQLKFDPKLNTGLMHTLISRVRIVLLLILTLVLAGIAAFASLPRELNPEVNIPIVMISSTLPGASPIEVERSLTKPIERSLNDLTDVDTLTSFSNNSFAQVMVQFGSGVDPDDAVDQVKTRVDRIGSDLPDNASQPRVSKLDFTNQPVLVVAINSPMNRASLGQLAETITDRLESNGSIARVEISGAMSETVKVKLDPLRLAQYNLSASQVTQSLQASNLSFPAGTLEVNGTEYTLNLDNQFQKLEQLQNLTLGSPAGPVSLSQVADVYYNYDDGNNRAYVILDGSRQTAVQLSIYKTSSATVFEAADAAMEVLEEYTRFDPNLSYTEVLNLSQSIKEQFDSLTNSFVSTILLVFVILLAFLGFSQAATASLAIPLTFLSAFLIMQLTGISLNFLSLFSLLLALGLVVDNAIVVVEAINQYRQRFSPMEAGLLVFRDFFVPIWTATLTTVWAFLPLLLAEGIIGEFIKSIPIVVSATLLSSTTIAVFINIPVTVILARRNWPRRVKVALGLVSILVAGLLLISLSGGSPLTPLVVILGLATAGFLYLSRQILARLLKVQLRRLRGRLRLEKLSRSRIANLLNQGPVNIAPLQGFYKSMVIRLLSQRTNRIKLYVLATGFVIISIGFAGSGLLKNEFFPLTDNENMYINIEAPLGTGLDYTEAVLSEVETIVSGTDGVASILSISGENFDDGFGGGGSDLNLAYVSVRLVPEQERQLSSMELAESLRSQFAQIAEAKVEVVEIAGGPPAGADLQINIKGNDLAVLEQISNDFIDMVRVIPGSVNINSSLRQTAGEIRFEPDALALARSGITPVQIGSTLRTLVSGSETTKLLSLDDDVVIEVVGNGRLTSLDQLNQVVIQGPSGATVLGDLGSFSLTTSPTVIEREDELRVVRVTAAASGSTTANQLLTEFEAAVADYPLPAGYSWDVGGINQENQSSVNSILMAMGLSAILILVTMVVQLESFRQSLLVMVVIPLGVAGVFFNFTIFGIPLSFPALIGVLAMFGIVVNNSIILIDKMNQNRRFGLTISDAITDAATSRLQPILLTSLTTSAGLLPITLSDPLWRGLGGAIIAGLSVSGALILLLLPSLYYEVYGDSGKSSR